MTARSISVAAEASLGRDCWQAGWASASRLCPCDLRSFVQADWTDEGRASAQTMETGMTWEPADHADDVLGAAVALATFAASSPALDARPTVRREVLRMYVLSLVTQGTLPRKGKTRYVSA